jgi:hypothetical protein
VRPNARPNHEPHKVEAVALGLDGVLLDFLCSVVVMRFRCKTHCLFHRLKIEAGINAKGRAVIEEATTGTFE